MSLQLTDLGATSEEELISSLAYNKRKQLEALEVQEVVEAKETLIHDLGIATEEIQALAKQDLDFLAALSAPDVFSLAFPPVFQAIWTWLLSFAHQVGVYPQLALGLPRGFGKTTFIKVFLLYCILFTEKRFILIVSSIATLAEAILADLMDMLSEPNIVNTFGDYRLGLEKDTQRVKKFGFRGRNIIIAAIGAEGNMRGINMKHSRPDIMVFEDIQSRECANSQVQSEALELWLIGTAMKAKANSGCMFLFVGNMYPTKYSILRKLKTNSAWIKFITGGILSDGTSLWEELRPIAQLMNEFNNDLQMGRPEEFYSEVLNDEKVQANNLINLSALPDLPYKKGDIPQGNFIVIDPATDKKNADAVSIGYFEVYETKPSLMLVKEGSFSPGATIREALKLALTHNCRIIGVEANAYQYSLCYWFDFICKQLGISGIQAVPIYSGSNAKNQRIVKMLIAYGAGELFIDPEARAAAHTQILDFNVMKLDNTDGILDLLTYAPRMVAEFSNLIAVGNLIEAQEYEAIDVPLYNTDF